MVRSKNTPKLGELGDPCPDCLAVMCKFHARGEFASTGEKQTALALDSGRGWLSKWRRAETRLACARHELKSTHAYIASERKLTAHIRTSPALARRLNAAQEEMRLALADVAKRKDSFASCMRWMLEGRVAP
jgi:hypothetical protein